MIKIFHFILYTLIKIVKHCNFVLHYMQLAIEDDPLSTKILTYQTIRMFSVQQVVFESCLSAFMGIAYGLQRSPAVYIFSACKELQPK